ncbi:MAG: hypothetical protein DME09_22505 [Candidatus Rokuibacteriota bacterium]|nr:MAG: hypothetical protein DME09_22505 [Candidatus Rokubacteria bacterium]
MSARALLGDGDVQITLLSSTASLWTFAVPEDGGFVPPDQATAKCEDGVTKTLTKLLRCALRCRARAATAALGGAPFDEAACESGNPATSCRAKYDRATATLVAAGNCPPCLDASALAGPLASSFDALKGALYCAGTTPFGGESAGFVPPDAATARCEAGIGTGVAKLLVCVGKCHIRRADLGVAGLPFDDDACERTDARKSCRAKYDKVSGALLAAGACPACLDSSTLAGLADQTEGLLDRANGQVYCASTTPF